MIRRLAIWSVALFLVIPSVALAQSGELVMPTNTPPVADSNAGTLPTMQAQEGTAPGAPSKEPDKLAALEQKLDALSKNLTVTTADPNIKIVVGGAIIADF